MKLAVITDSSAYLDNKVVENEHLFVLDIPVSIDGVEYIEGKIFLLVNFIKKWQLLVNCQRRANRVLLA